jgi:tRNA G26 N,N-dimethylase Trm1
MFWTSVFLELERMVSKSSNTEHQIGGYISNKTQMEELNSQSCSDLKSPNCEEESWSIHVYGSLWFQNLSAWDFLSLKRWLARLANEFVPPQDPGDAKVRGILKAWHPKRGFCG